MSRTSNIKCLFLDIGGVLLTNGWDHLARKRAAVSFRLDRAEMEARHALTFDTYEEGAITLRDYLDRVIFYKKQNFTRSEFQKFMFAQSKPYPKMISLIKDLKEMHGFKVFVVSNEARDLNSHRIKKFKLNLFVDSFISSCFIHIRKPDVNIFRLAIDISQTPLEQIVYIENTPLFVQVAENLGIQSILHKDYLSTRAKLASLGLVLGQKVQT